MEVNLSLPQECGELVRNALANSSVAASTTLPSKEGDFFEAQRSRKHDGDGSFYGDVLLSYRMFCIEHSTKRLLGFYAADLASGGLNRMRKPVQMPKETPKLDDGRSGPDDHPASPFPDPDKESSSVAKINKWIALGDIALGQGIGRRTA